MLRTEERLDVGYISLDDFVLFNSDGTFTDPSTGNQLQYLGSQLWQDPSAGYIEDQSGTIQVPAAQVRAAGTSLMLALAAADRANKDVAAGNVQGARNDLASARNFASGISAELTDAARVAGAAISAAQANLAAAQGNDAGVAAARSGFESSTGAQQSFFASGGNPVDVGGGSALWDTFSGAVNDLTFGAFGQGGALGTRNLLPKLRNGAPCLTDPAACFQTAPAFRAVGGAVIGAAVGGLAGIFFAGGSGWPTVGALSGAVLGGLVAYKTAPSQT